MIEFERSSDYELIAALLKHPAIWPYIGDDFCAPRDEWLPVADSRIWYVFAREGRRILGLYVFVPLSAVLWEVHASMLPAAWGAQSRRAGRNVVAWLFEHTTCRRLVAAIPATNRPAIAYARAAGLIEYGRNPRAFMKGGELRDVVLLGISKD